jgi:predicted ATP-grasp superfamily ATP-dependent carboligase
MLIAIAVGLDSLFHRNFEKSGPCPFVRIFVYEHITGGGTYVDTALGRPCGSLLAEGSAMLRALVADFELLDGVEVVFLRDARLTGLGIDGNEGRIVRSVSEYWQAFDQTAAESDGTLVVAPEIGGALLRCCQTVVDAGGRLVSPGPSAVAIASNKFTLQRRLRDEDVPVPQARRVAIGDPPPVGFPFPAVIKPVDGAGSMGVRLIRSADEWSWEANPSEQQGWLLQQYRHGTPASVALLCCPSGVHPLIPCRQRFDGSERFAYRGGSLPLEPQLAKRAVRLAVRATQRALPGVVGYLGVDLMLGGDPSGGEDVVIEINPRVTTSYVGLRAAANTNLAAAMLAVAEDRAPDMRFSPESLEFDADGTVRCAI